jgi:hypothetical protein
MDGWMEVAKGSCFVVAKKLSMTIDKWKDENMRFLGNNSHLATFNLLFHFNNDYYAV